MTTIVVRQSRIRCWQICDGLNGYALNSRKTERGAVALAKARNPGCAVLVWPMDGQSYTIAPEG
jgi:hypothetical protein